MCAGFRRLNWHSITSLLQARRGSPTAPAPTPTGTGTADDTAYGIGTATAPTPTPNLRPRRVLVSSRRTDPGSVSTT